MKIIGFVGLPGSGKGEASKIARELGLSVVVMGDVIRQEAARQGLEPTDQNLGRIGNALREKEGAEAIARKTLKMARKTGRDLVVVDGLRSGAEAEFFRSQADEFYLIEVWAAADARLGRLEKRGRPDDPKVCGEVGGNASAEGQAKSNSATAATIIPILKVAPITPRPHRLKTSPHQNPTTPSQYAGSALR